MAYNRNDQFQGPQMPYSSDSSNYNTDSANIDREQQLGIYNTMSKQGQIDRGLQNNQPILVPTRGGDQEIQLGHQLSDPIAQILQRVGYLKAMQNDAHDPKAYQEFSQQIDPLQNLADMYMHKSSGNGNFPSISDGGNSSNGGGHNYSAGMGEYVPQHLAPPRKTQADLENEQLASLRRKAMIHYLSIRDPHLLSSLGQNPFVRLPRRL